MSAVDLASTRRAPCPTCKRPRDICTECGTPARVIDGEAVHIDALGIPYRQDHEAELHLGCYGAPQGYVATSREQDTIAFSAACMQLGVRSSVTQGKCTACGRFYYFTGRAYFDSSTGATRKCPTCRRPLSRTSSQSTLPRYVIDRAGRVVPLEVKP